MRRGLAAILGATLGLLFTCATAPALAAACASGLLTGPAALRSDWDDDKPGLCRRLLPANIVRPSASDTSYSNVVPVPAGTLPKVPSGFHVSRFYRGVEKPRLIRTSPNGDIFVAESLAGRIRVLRPSSI